MKIPWFITIPLCLLVTLITLYLCIKDEDIVTPPNPEIANSDTNEANDTAPKKTETTGHTEDQSKKESIPATLPTIKIPAISPSLSHLTEENKNSSQLIIFAEQMKKNNKLQLARIAYERIIDHASDSSANDRKLAASAIAKLSKQTPLWNPDPSLREKFTISITINKKHEATAKELIPKLETSLAKATDGILEPNIKLSLNTSPLSSVAITGNKSPVRFSIKDTASVSKKIHAAIYNVVRNKNNHSQKIITIPPLPENISAELTLQTYITRLAWKNAAK